jgi:hypothetical protein
LTLTSIEQVKKRLSLRLNSDFDQALRKLRQVSDCVVQLFDSAPHFCSLLLLLDSSPRFCSSILLLHSDPRFFSSLINL